MSDERADPASSRRCLICGGLEFRPIFNEFEVPVVRCRGCRHVFSTYERGRHYDGFWGNVIGDDDQAYWREARAPMYRAFLDRFVAGRSGRLLDMGCGLGYFVKVASEHRSWEVYGCEISAAAVGFAREKLGLDRVICARPEEADFPARFFDLITLWDVLDHLSHPDALLTHCRRLLREGGICFIRSPNVVVQLARARVTKLVYGMRDDRPYLQARDHAHHYSTSSLAALLNRNGFSRVEFTHLPPVDRTDRGGVAKAARLLSFEVIRGVAATTGGRINLDNLFAIAHA